LPNLSLAGFCSLIVRFASFAEVEFVSAMLLLLILPLLTWLPLVVVTVTMTHDEN